MRSVGYFCIIMFNSATTITKVMLNNANTMFKDSRDAMHEITRVISHHEQIFRDSISLKFILNLNNS
jgi:hypothetical protein